MENSKIVDMDRMETFWAGIFDGFVKHQNFDDVGVFFGDCPMECDQRFEI
jgi:hypothetical protein